jgi:hypothetical protein
MSAKGAYQIRSFGSQVNAMLGARLPRPTEQTLAYRHLLLNECLLPATAIIIRQTGE